MTLKEAIERRHSVRDYIDRPIGAEALAELRARVAEANAEGGLHIQLVTDEPRGYGRGLAYGTFKGVSNYFVMAGPKGPDLDERIGYHGERLVLEAQALGLNTCWTGLTYSKTKGAYELEPGERIACCIALGYGRTQGTRRKSKAPGQVSNAGDDTPAWFMEGVKAALLAPTAMNQQRFRFEYLGSDGDGKPTVRAERGFSPFGYTLMDLGIAKCNFEIGAGRENFDWA